MKRIMVIGCPGSGKSTFSRELRSKTGIPLYHLDMMNWNADRTTVEKRVFLERLSNVLEKYSYEHIIVFKSRNEASVFLSKTPLASDKMK